MNDLAKYIDFGQGAANPGYIWNIKNVMKRAEAGKKLTIGFIGGSITQGSLSSTPQKCYAYLVYEWWVRTFPNARFEYVNAGIGGTTSQFGVARAQDDLLSKNPDFVIAELFTPSTAEVSVFAPPDSSFSKTVYSCSASSSCKSTAVCTPSTMQPILLLQHERLLVSLTFKKFPVNLNVT